MGVPIRYNLRNLLERKATTLMTAVGIGLTVAVLVVALALTAGLNSVFAETGDPRQLILLRKGTDAELTSTISEETYQVVRTLPGIARNAKGEPLVSPEGLTVVNLPSVDSPEGMNVTVRGLLPIGLDMRSFTVTRGEMFKPGLRQIVVGESIARRYPSAQVGRKLRFGRGEWEVVGVFSTSASAANSEIWADLNQLRGDFDRAGGSSSLLIRVDVPAEQAAAQMVDATKAYNKAVAERNAALKASPGAELPVLDEPLPPALAAIRTAVANDQRLGSSVLSEKSYYEKQTASGMPLQFLGFSVAIIMSIGSAFAATNTMYAAVARRGREIGTLRALGFSRIAILLSFMTESVCLALVGGLFGILLALPINGFATGVGNFSTFSETAFQLRVTPGAIVAGLLFAACIGALGGFLPAWAAARKTIVQAMREA